MLKSDLCEKLRERIKASDLWVDGKSRESSSSFYLLRCPECGKTEAWAYRDFPATIMCNRKNQCGARIKSLDLFPELLVNIEKDFAPTKDDPNRPAREYLYSRGLTSKSLAGLKYEYRRNIRKSGSGGVLFFIGKNSAGEDVWNGRLFTPPPGVGKTHNQGSTAGLFWQHPGVRYDPNRTVYVVEGIIDALSLIELGLQAIAVLSAGQDPSKIDLSVFGGDQGRLLIFAFDKDNAGARGIKRWLAAYPAAKAIVPLVGDWNDFIRDNNPDKALSLFTEKLPEMSCRADLLLSESARDYADIFTVFYGYPPGLFEFGKSYWFAQIGKGTGRNGEPNIVISCVSNFTCETDHYQLDSTGSDNNPVYRYCLKIHPTSGTPVYCSVTGSDLAHPQALRSALLCHAKVDWKGEAAPSKALVSEIVGTKAPTVRQIHLLGHDKDSGCIVFQDFLIDPNGTIRDLDARGFFRASRKEYLRPPASLATLKPRKGASLNKIYDLIGRAWPHNGHLAVAYAVSSWFVYCVKRELGFFPFLSLWGDTQTGKSWLVRVLNGMQCLDEEGMPMTKLNTGKGEIRKLAQRAGLFKALLEGNAAEKARFDMESLLTLFNHGNSLQVRAVKSNGIETKETEFLSSLIFVQNKEPFTSKAQMERVISSKEFKNSDINEATTEAFRELLKIPLQELAQCYVSIMSHRKSIEETWYGEYLKARNEILEAIPDNRIAETHGLLLAFHRLAENFFGANLDLPASGGRSRDGVNGSGGGVQDNFKSLMIWLAENKYQRCNHRQATQADEFFDACDALDETRSCKFMELEGGRLFVRLGEALKVLDGNGYKFYKGQLHKELREHPAFVDSRQNRRSYWGEIENSSVQRVWVFDADKIVEA